MRPARPVTCEPRPVITPVKSEPESVNNGNCGLPDVSEETVVVVEAALTVALLVPSSVTFNVGPEAENCRWSGPSAVFNCERIDAIPPEKLTPITSGVAPGAFGSGSAAGSSTRTICNCCWRPVALLVNVRLIVLPGCRLLPLVPMLRLKPAGGPVMAAPGMV